MRKKSVFKYGVELRLHEGDEGNKNKDCHWHVDDSTDQNI